MHARRRGSSGSKRPLTQKNPPWVVLEGGEIEELILRLHGEGLSAAQIGLRLRDQYGVPNVRLATGKSVLQILRAREAKLPLPDDLRALMKKAVGLQAHLRENPKDHHNRRGLELVEAKIRRLVKYYKREGSLPVEWDYSLKAAELQTK
jgi:small subunit ribosomal protein S15